jgi:hypothetical protein
MPSISFCIYDCGTGSRDEPPADRLVLVQCGVVEHHVRTSSGARSRVSTAPNMNVGRLRAEQVPQVVLSQASAIVFQWPSTLDGGALADEDAAGIAVTAQVGRLTGRNASSGGAHQIDALREHPGPHRPPPRHAHSLPASRRGVRP